MSPHEQFKMTFVCNQDWNSMSVTNKGRYCHLCQRPVLDLTDRTIPEILEEKARHNNDLCARIKIEEDDPDIIAPVTVPKTFRLFALASSLVFTLSTKTVSAQQPDPAHTEQTDTARRLTEKSLPAACDTTVQKDSALAAGKPNPFLKTKRKEYYWTKTFPFIKRTYRKRTRILSGFI
jgi:hypothetical protein